MIDQPTPIEPVTVCEICADALNDSTRRRYVPARSNLLSALDMADQVGAEALERYGAEAQTRMLVEEVGELLTAVARCARGRGARSDVVEECADVIIVALQVARMYSGGADDLAQELARKANRLSKRLAETEAKRLLKQTWVKERRCWACRHADVLASTKPCSSCFSSNGHVNWEPML